MPESLAMSALRELQATTCANCRGPKRSSNSFCLPCYKQLPAQVQRDLYKGFGEGYAQIYAEAKELLKAHDRYRKPTPTQG
jgi:hypothetical protein